MEELKCPACDAPFKISYIGLTIESPDKSIIVSIENGDVKLDFSFVKDYFIYSLKCASCGEYVYHRDNLKWGEFKSRKESLKTGEWKYGKGKPATVKSEQDLIIEYLKANPAFAKALTEGVK